MRKAVEKVKTAKLNAKTNVPLLTASLLAVGILGPLVIDDLFVAPVFERPSYLSRAVHSLYRRETNEISIIGNRLSRVANRGAIEMTNLSNSLRRTGTHLVREMNEWRRSFNEIEMNELLRVEEGRSLLPVVLGDPDPLPAAISRDPFLREMMNPQRFMYEDDEIESSPLITYLRNSRPETVARQYVSDPEFRSTINILMDRRGRANTVLRNIHQNYVPNISILRINRDVSIGYDFDSERYEENMVRGSKLASLTLLGGAGYYLYNYFPPLVELKKKIKHDWNEMKERIKSK